MKARDETGNVSTKFNVAAATFGIRTKRNKLSEAYEEDIVSKGSKESHDTEEDKDSDDNGADTTTIPEHTSPETTTSEHISSEATDSEHITSKATSPGIINTDSDKESTEIFEDSFDEMKKDKEIPEEHSGNNSFKWWPIAVGIGVAITVIMVIVLISVIIIKKTRMKTYFSVQSEQC